MQEIQVTTTITVKMGRKIKEARYVTRIDNRLFRGRGRCIRRD